MKAKHYVAISAIATLLMPALWAVVHAAEKPDGSVPRQRLVSERDTLRGLQGILVRVIVVQSEAEQFGLTHDAVQTDTELQLRQYGIKVLSPQEWLNTSGSPHLVVTVQANGMNDDTVPLVAVSMDVQLYQDVYLKRDSAICCMATTWSARNVARVGRNNLRQARDSIKDLVAAFINDYLAANPKQPAPIQEDRGSEAKQG